MKFKKFGGQMIDDLGQYMRDYLLEHPNVRIYVGCDSEKMGRQILYVTTICMYDSEMRDGVHYILCKEWIPRKGTKGEDTAQMIKRIWGEVEKVAQVGEYLEKEIDGYIKRFASDELIKMELQPHQTKLVDVDIDINPDIGIRGENKSNKLIDAAMGFLVGCGFRTRCKPDAWAASCAADFHCKPRKNGRRKKKSRKQ